jgi:hypothetical protein
MWTTLAVMAHDPHVQFPKPILVQVPLINSYVHAPHAPDVLSVFKKSFLRTDAVAFIKFSWECVSGVIGTLKVNTSKHLDSKML